MADVQRHVARFTNDSRIPGWDRAADLDKEPAVVPDAATTEVPAELRAAIEDGMRRFPVGDSAFIPALYAVQEHYGWCPPHRIEQAAAVLGRTPAALSAVATFYDMFEMEQLGRKTVYVCTNISCSLCGADELLAALEGELGEDPDVNVRGFECLGACDIAPMASINGIYVGPIELSNVPELARQIRQGDDPLPELQLIKRPSADPKVAEK